MSKKLTPEDFIPFFSQSGDLLETFSAAKLYRVQPRLICESEEEIENVTPFWTSQEDTVELLVYGPKMLIALTNDESENGYSHALISCGQKVVSKLHCFIYFQPNEKGAGFGRIFVKHDDLNSEFWIEEYLVGE